MASAVAPQVEEASRPSSDGGSSPGTPLSTLQQGGTVKIPLEQLPRNSPFPVVPPTGVTTSTAPLLRAAPSSAPGSGSHGRGASQGILSSPKARTMMVIAAAAVVLTVVLIGAYALVSSPGASASSPEAATEPSVMPAEQPPVAVSPSAESAPAAAPSASAVASASAEAEASPPAVASAAEPAPDAAPTAPAAPRPTVQPVAQPAGTSAQQTGKPAPKPLRKCGKLIKTNCQ
ncbi:MAG: hypothetical protein HUU21_38820 [Polyangiaceae bacterium]|nr:hypothetical protein [Polyangiaceae bacterium]